MPSAEWLASLEKLSESLHHKFNNLGILAEALQHSSYVNECLEEELSNNERLEFLGDAVVSLVVSLLLYERFPDQSEGELSKLRSYLISAAVLSKKTANLKLSEYLLLGKGEELSGGRHKKSILTNLYEAVTAAIYLDGGLEAVQKFLRAEFEELIITTVEDKLYLQDYKSLLQEFSQINHSCVPIYRTYPVEIKTGLPFFESFIYLENLQVGSGRGHNKKEAEQAAAKTALSRLRKDKTI